MRFYHQPTTEMCDQVQTEPDLQSVSAEAFVSKSTNTQDRARFDTVVDGFWGEDIKEPSVMSARSTHMHHPTEIAHCQPSIGSTRERRRMCARGNFLKFNIRPSLH